MNRAFIFFMFHSAIIAPSIADIDCPIELENQIPLTSQKPFNLRKLRTNVVRVYYGVLEESAGSIVKASLKEAIEAEDPFAIRGRGRFWPEAFASLESIQEFVDSHAKSADLRRALLDELVRLSTEPKKREAKRVVERKKAGTAAPLTVRTELKHTPPSPMGLAVSPDGGTLITVGERGEIVAYDLHSKRPKKLYKKAEIAPNAEFNRWGDYYATWPIFPITFTEDSSRFAVSITSSRKLVLKLLHTNSGRVAVDLGKLRRKGSNDDLPGKGHEIVFSSDGKYGAYCGGHGSYESTEAVWNIAKQKTIAAYKPRFSAGASGVFSTDNQFYFSSYQTFGFRAYHLPTETELISPLKVPESELDSYRGTTYGSAVGWVGEGIRENTFLGQSTRGGLQIVEVDYSKLKKAMTNKPFVYRNGTRVDTNGNRKIRYAKKDGTKRTVLNSTRAPTTDEFDEGGLRLSPDHKYIVSHFTSHDRFGTKVGTTVLQVFAVGKWSRPIRNLSRFHKAKIRKMEFSPDGRFFLTLSTDKKLRVFDVNGPSKFRLLVTLGGEDNRILNFAVSSDSTKIFLVEDEKITMRNLYEENIR